MKVKDSQFLNYLLNDEIDLDRNLVNNLLDYNIEIRRSGPADSVVEKNDTLIYSNPSSLTRFLFESLYALLSRYVKSDILKDKLGLGLLYQCRDYVYSDFEPMEFTGPPVLLGFNKLPVPSFIIHELIEPLVGKIDTRPVFFLPSKYLDVCTIVHSQAELSRRFDVPTQSVSASDFPIIACNAAVYNSGATYAHLLTKTLDLSLGEEKSRKVLKNVLLNKEGHLAENLILILNTLNGEPEFILNFLKFLHSNSKLNVEESTKANKLAHKAMKSYARLNESIKIANTNNTQIFKQWHQWSMLMGLIEKQLAPMRGSMWPASKHLKPYEDKQREQMVARAKDKNKNQLNFEEMLETARDMYDKNAIEPGKLIEQMLRNNRVWKM